MSQPQLPPTIQALLQPQAYPERPASVELRQTHISYLFFTPEHVYKVKKPVDFGFLDFSTLEKRRHFCRQELELNRRLSPEIYLAVVEVRGPTEREAAIEGPGRVLEYAVKMRRLPKERMLDRLLQINQVSAEMVAQVAERIAQFHQNAATSPEIARFGGLEGVRANITENFDQTVPYIGQSLPQATYDAIERYNLHFLEEKRALLERRVQKGRIRDCHGDLHADQICLSDGVQFIDCIEFNERFRYGDVASDIAFLAMDLDNYGRYDLSRTLMEAYVAASHDEGALELLNFYKCYRAYVRGKVESFRLDDPYVPPQEKTVALERARDYFHLAHTYAAKADTPRLVLVCGLVGTGKSTVAQGLARKQGMVVISSDVVRKRLAGIPAREHHYEPFDIGLYAPDSSRRTYEEMLRLVRQLLEEGHSVVLDATFRYRNDRQRAFALAQDLGADPWLVETICQEEVVRERLERRVQEGTSVSDGRWEIYQREKGAFDPVNEVPQARHLTVDTSAQAIQESAEKVLAQLLPSQQKPAQLPRPGLPG